MHGDGGGSLGGGDKGWDDMEDTATGSGGTSSIGGSLRSLLAVRVVESRRIWILIYCLTMVG